MKTITAWRIIAQASKDLDTCTRFLVCSDDNVVHILDTCLGRPIVWPQSEDGNDEFMMDWFQTDPRVDIAELMVNAQIYDQDDIDEILKQLEEDL